MLKKKICLLVLIALACTGCSTLALMFELGAQKPTVKSIRPRFSSISFQGIKIEFDIELDNPNSFPLKSPQLRGALIIQGKELLRTQTDSTIDIPAGGSNVVTFPMTLKYVDILRTCQDLKDAANVDYTLQGAIVIKLLGVNVELPISHSGSMPLMKLPTFSHVDIRSGDVGVNTASLVLGALVQNPNVFELDLSNLAYTLKLGDVDIAQVKTVTAGTVAAGETGQVSVSVELPGIQAFSKLADGCKLGSAQLVPSGLVHTPYGMVDLSNSN